MKYRNYNQKFNWKEVSRGRKIALLAVVLLFLSLLGYGTYRIIQNYRVYRAENNRIAEELRKPEVTKLKVTFVSFEKTWNMGMEELIERFEREHSNIDIEYDIIYETGLYEDAVNKRYARDDLGDLVELVEPMNYVLNDLLAPLPETISDMVDQSFDFGDQVYGVATVGYTTGVIYNKRVFDRYGLTPPESYEDFLKICERLKGAGVAPLVVGGANRWHLSYLLDQFYLYEDSGNAWVRGLNPTIESSNWQDEVIRNVFEELYQLFENGYVVTKWEDVSNDMAAEYLAQGAAAMLFTSTFTINEAYALNSNSELGWFYLPDDEGNEVRDYKLHGYWTMTKACAEDEGKAEAAEEFLSYFYSQGVYENLCNSVVGIPMVNRATVLDDNNLRAEAYGAEIPAEDAFNVDLTNSMLPQDFRSYLAVVTKGVMKGAVSPEDAGRILQEKWETIQGEHVYEEFDP